MLNGHMGEEMMYEPRIMLDSGVPDMSTTRRACCSIGRSVCVRLRTIEQVPVHG